MGPDPPSPGTMSWYIIDMESSNELEPSRSFWSKMLSVTTGRLRMHHHLMTVDIHNMMGFNIKTHGFDGLFGWNGCEDLSQVFWSGRTFWEVFMGRRSITFFLTVQDHDTSFEAYLGGSYTCPMRTIHNWPIIYVSMAKVWMMDRVNSKNIGGPKPQQSQTMS